MDNSQRKSHKQKDTTVSKKQLIGEMDKTAQEISQNSEELKRDADSQMHQREEENQKPSVEEINAEKIILLKEENAKLITKCEDFERKIQELVEEKKDLAKKAKCYEAQLNLPRNNRRKINKKCQLAMEKQRSEKKVHSLEAELNNLTIKYKKSLLRSQRLDNQIREEEKRYKASERRIQEQQEKLNQWERKNKFYETELQIFKAEMSELTTLATSLNTHIREKNEINLQLTQTVKHYESKLKQLMEIKEQMAMEKEKNEIKIQQLEENLKELAIKFESCKMRNQWLNNQMNNQQAQKCGFEGKIQKLEKEKIDSKDFEREIQKLDKEKIDSEDFEREMQKLEKEKIDSEDFERELQVLKEHYENMEMTAGYYEKKVLDLEKANQKLSHKELLYQGNIREMVEQETVLAMANEGQKIIIQLLKEEIKEMEEKHSTKVDLLQQQKSKLKNICKHLLKKSKNRKSPWYFFRNGRKNDEKQAKETQVEVEPEQEKEKKGLMNWIRGLWTSMKRHFDAVGVFFTQRL